MLRKIVLHGEAGEKFIDEVELDVSSMAEATRALQVFFPEFRQFLVENNFHIVHEGVEMWDLGEEHINFQLGRGTLHIIPVLEGSAKDKGKGNALMKIVAGVVIAAVAWWAAPAAGGLGATIFGGGMLGGLTYGNVVMLGLGLALSGLSSLLTPKKTNTEEDDSSFMLSGQLNQTAQGGAVPLIYGRTDVSSVLISAGVESVDIPVGSSDSGSVVGGSK